MKLAKSVRMFGHDTDTHLDYDFPTKVPVTFKG